MRRRGRVHRGLAGRDRGGQLLAHARATDTTTGKDVIARRPSFGSSRYAGTARARSLTTLTRSRGDLTHDEQLRSIACFAEPRAERDLHTSFSGERERCSRAKLHLRR